MATITTSVMTYEERHRATFLLGPWLIGSLVDIFLQGVLCCQFMNYFTWHNRDEVGMRLAVVGLSLMTTLKTIHSVAILWVMFIIHFKDIDGATLMVYTVWWHVANPVLVASIGIYVQIFFCRRLWLISDKNMWYVLPVGTVLLFAYVSVCVATYYISQGEAYTGIIDMWFAAHLSSVFAGDLLLTSLTAYLLLQSSKDVLPETAGLLHALVRLTFQTAAPAALCAMFNLLFSQLYSGRTSLVSTAFNQSLPKLYAFSMMWTLNARRSISHDSPDNLLCRTKDFANHRRSDVEHTTTGYQFQVHTHTECTRHSVELQESNDHLEEVKRKE